MIAELLRIFTLWLRDPLARFQAWSARRDSAAAIELLPLEERADPLKVNAAQRLAYCLYCVTAAAQTPIVARYTYQAMLFSREYYRLRETLVNGWDVIEETNPEVVDPFGVMLFKNGEGMCLTIVGGTDGESVTELAQKVNQWPSRTKPKDQELPY